MKIINNETVGKNIAELIKKDGRSVSKIALVSGMQQAQLSSFKKGQIKSFSFDTLSKLCVAFGVTPNDILLGKNSIEEILKAHESISVEFEIAKIELAKAELEAKLIELREQKAIREFEPTGKGGEVHE